MATGCAPDPAEKFVAGENVTVCAPATLASARRRVERTVRDMFSSQATEVGMLSLQHRQGMALRLKELESLEKVTGKIDRISVFQGLEGVLKH